MFKKSISNRNLTHFLAQEKIETSFLLSNSNDSNVARCCLSELLDMQAFMNPTSDMYDIKLSVNYNKCSFLWNFRKFFIGSQGL